MSGGEEGRYEYGKRDHVIRARGQKRKLESAKKEILEKKKLVEIEIGQS